MDEELVSLLFETKAFKVAPADNPFWYTSGKLGPCFINVDYLYGSAEDSANLLSKIDNLLETTDKEEIPYEFIKSILESFGKILNENVEIEQQKKLLHMIISEITINELREVDSIKLKINDNLIEYLSKEEGVSIKDAPSSFMLRNIGISILNLDIAV